MGRGRNGREENGRDGNENEDLGGGRDDLRGVGNQEEGMRGNGINGIGIPCFKKGMGFIGINARSILPKMSEIKKLAKDSSASVLAVCETWLDGSIGDGEIQVEGYSILRKDRDRHGGGVLLYIKDTVAFNLRTDLESEQMESVWAEIMLPKSRGILVCSIYRPPTDNGFIVNLEASLEKVDAGKEVYILGDVNIDYGNKGSNLCRGRIRGQSFVGGE